MAHSCNSEAQNKNARSVGPKNMGGGGREDEGCLEELMAAVSSTATNRPKKMSSNSGKANGEMEGRLGDSEGAMTLLGTRSIKTMQIVSSSMSGKVIFSTKTEEA